MKIGVLSDPWQICHEVMPPCDIKQSNYPHCVWDAFLNGDSGRDSYSCCMDKYLATEKIDPNHIPDPLFVIW